MRTRIKVMNENAEKTLLETVMMKAALANGIERKVDGGDGTRCLGPQLEVPEET